MGPITYDRPDASAALPGNPIVSKRERMAPVDVSWLRMDRPTNHMVVVSVLILAPPVDIARVKRTIATRLLAVDRFRQRIERATTGFWWSDDAQFDIDRHIKHVRLPGAGGKVELQRLVAELTTLPLDDAHPLWQYHLVEDYEGGAAIIARTHHAVGDGMALVHVLLSLTDDRPDAPEAGPSAVAARHDGGGEDAWPALLEPVTTAITQGFRLSAAAWRALQEMAANPAKAVDYARQGTGIVGELAYLLLMPMDTPTRFKGKPRGEKRVAWSEPIPLPEVKAVGRVLGCSVNDLLLASVAGALRNYLAESGDATAGVEVRAVVPVNLRPPGSESALGNRFGVVGIELPVGIENPLARLYEVRRRMEQLKRSYEPSVTLGLFAMLGLAPQIVQEQLFDLLLSRATAVMTNVPGPRHPLYVGGASIRQMMFWVPQSGDIGMGVSILSFDGRVQFGLMTDAALVPDPEAVIAHFRPEFEKLLYFVLMELETPAEASSGDSGRHPPRQPSSD
jgi:diacylglycerol O-acyltransferase / wax synthase